MRQYYYIQNNERYGPFSYEEMCTKQFESNVKIWYKGLPNWTDISNVPELSHLIQSKKSIFLDIRCCKKRENKRIIYLAGIIIILIWGGILGGRWIKDKIQYRHIVRSAYVDPDVDFSKYLEKYYRDIECCGIIPTRPKQTIIKFADLDKYGDTKHIHAISYGYNNDDIVEIYVNPSSWKSFKKGMRYWLMYHELCHDVLNVEDLEDLPQNEGKLMYPLLTVYEKKTMDDFIESFHQFIEEYHEN